jgi:hypothetical protein
VKSGHGQVRLGRIRARAAGSAPERYHWQLLLLLLPPAVSGCDSSQPAAPASAKAAIASAGGSSPAAPLWTDQARFVHSLELKSSLSVSGASSVAFEMTAEVLIDARRLPDRRVELALTLPAAKFVTDDASARAGYDALSEELLAPIVGRFDDAKLEEVRMKPGASPFAIAIASTLASALQVSYRPRASPGDVWTTQEVDGTGSYEAEYRRSTEANTVSKRKLRYDPVMLRQGMAGSFKASFTPEVQSSAGTIVLSPLLALNGSPAGFRIARVETAEKLTNRIGGTEVASETKLRLTFTRQTSAEPAIDWSSLLAATKVIDRSAPARAADTSYDSLRIGNYTYETALAELQRQAEDPKQKELSGQVHGRVVAPADVSERQARLAEQSKVFTAMGAIFRSRPQDIATALKDIRKKTPVARMLIDAIASAGTKPAQRALVELMENNVYAPADRKAAAFAISRLANASPDAVEALSRRLADPQFHVYALFGLGTICRRLREAGESERSDRIAEILIAQLGKAKSPGEQVEALRAIANSGHSSAFDAVKPFFSAKQNKVRVAAVDSIRLMQRLEVDEIVAASLIDSQPDVQLAAVDAASVREPSDTLVNALGPAADKIDKVSTRLKLVRVMGHYLPKRPELRANLEKLATNDPSADVQKAARAELGS